MMFRLILLGLTLYFVFRILRSAISLGRNSQTRTPGTRGTNSRSNPVSKVDVNYQDIKDAKFEELEEK
jgi:hypothetical protein